MLLRANGLLQLSLNLGRSVFEDSHFCNVWIMTVRETFVQEGSKDPEQMFRIERESVGEASRVKNKTKTQNGHHLCSHTNQLFRTYSCLFRNIFSN